MSIFTLNMSTNLTLKGDRESEWVFYICLVFSFRSQSWMYVIFKYTISVKWVQSLSQLWRMKMRAICECPFKRMMLLMFNLLQIQTELNIKCKCTHDNSNQHNDIWLIVKNIIQSEHKSSADVKQFTSAESSLSSQSKTSWDVHSAQKLCWSVNHLHKYWISTSMISAVQN